MVDKTPAPEADDELPPSFSEEMSAAFAAALGRAGFAKLAPGTMPHSSDLIAALGGVRGLVESILPSLAFLVAFTVSAIVLDAPSYLLWSVGTPVVCAVIFIVARIITRSALRSAVTGAVIAVVTGGLALISGRASDTFVFGIVVNGASLAVVLLTLILRRPLIGLIVGLLTSDEAWRDDPAKRRVLTIATWLWAALFALRLAVELPLFIVNSATGLAISKLVLGVPLYAMLLWVTWLLVGTVYSTAERDPRDTSDV